MRLYIHVDEVLGLELCLKRCTTQHIVGCHIGMWDIEEIEGMCRDIDSTLHTLIAKVGHYEEHLICCLAHERILTLCQMLVDIHKVEEIALAYCLLSSCNIKHLVVK